MHTVFSDGQVWPTTRVDEAVREGLDAIAITDHIEYQPHRADIPTNHGRSYEIAKGPAEGSKLLFPLAAEITRSTPPGHFNAIFLRDVRYLDTEEFLDAVKAANDQNAFVFWNHPDWKPEHIGWFDVHDTLYENKCDLNIELKRTGMVGPEEVILPAMETTTIKLRVQNDIKNVELDYVAGNMLIAPGKGLPVKLTGSLE